MLRHSLLALAALLVPAPTATATPDLSVIQPDAIVQVVCLKGQWIISGTAFRIGAYYLSVKHVTSSGQCFIAGKPIKLVYTGDKQDFSILSADEGPFIPIDCGGFVKGRKYLAIGFARGESPATVVELTATGTKDGEWSVLTGMWTVIPGMSGGVVLSEETGRAVGTINVENFEQGISGSLQLKDTPICSQSVA